MLINAPIRHFTLLTDKAHHQINGLNQHKEYSCPVIYQGTKGTFQMSETSSSAMIVLGNKRRTVSWKDAGELLLNLKNGNQSIKSMQSIIEEKLAKFSQLSAVIQSVKGRPLSDYRARPESSMIVRDGGSLECRLIGPSAKEYVLVFPVDHSTEDGRYLKPRLYLERWSDDYLIQNLNWPEVHEFIKKLKSKNEYFQVIQNIVREHLL